MNNSRREFLKISSLGLGGVALSAPLFNWAHGAIASDQPPAAENIINRTPTYCEVCFWKCAGWVYKNDEGNIWKIIGNDEDPHCNGRLCPRGTGGVGMYYDEDRLKTPLIRKTIDGKQQFVEASWDEALDLVAENLNKVKAKYGAECTALFTHGSGGKFFGICSKHLDLPTSRPRHLHNAAGPERWLFWQRTVKLSLLRSAWTSEIQNAWCLLALTSARICTMARCRKCRMPSTKAPTSSPSIRAFLLRHPSQNIGCR
jgi:thiosulfate reductase/polysulfide reductase chain A